MTYSDDRADAEYKMYQILFFMTIILAMIDLPAIILGLILQRLLTRFIDSKEVRFFIWLVPAIVSVYLYIQAYPAMKDAMTNNFSAWIGLFSLHVLHQLVQLQPFTWPSWGELKVALTTSLPLWIAMLGTIPAAAAYHEVFYNTRANTVKRLQRQERSRQRRIDRHQRKAQKRTQRPDQLPTSIGGEMVIGAMIHREEE